MKKQKGFLEIIRDMEMPKVNDYIIKNIREESLAEYVVEAFKTLENPYLKVTGYELITDESKFDPDEVNMKHVKNARVGEAQRNEISMTDSRYNLLRIHFHIDAEKRGNHTVDVLIFKPYKKYYYLSGGNRYYPIYQLVDTATYANKKRLTLKTLLLPIIVRAKDIEIIDDRGESFYVPDYRLQLFKKDLIPFLYYTANMGLLNTLKYFNLEEIILITEESTNSEDMYSFTLSNKVYVNIYKEFFTNDNFCKNTVYELLALIGDDEYNDIFENDWAIYKMGGNFVDKNDKNKAYIKGCDILYSFSRLLDSITKNNLKLDIYNKRDTFSVLRWMIRNYDDLKSVDNMDLANKRIRMHEYMISPLINHFSSKMIRFLKINKPKYKDLIDLITLDKRKFIDLNSGKKSLLRYDGVVNDQDFFTACKYTVKGPGAIGEKSSRTIPMEFRDLHESYVGRIDMNTCSTSDPGLSGVINPFQDLHSKYFDTRPEIQNWYKNFKKRYKKVFGKKYKIKELDYFYTKKLPKIHLLHEAGLFVKDNPYLDNTKRKASMHVKVTGRRINQDIWDMLKDVEKKKQKNKKIKVKIKKKKKRIKVKIKKIDKEI